MTKKLFWENPYQVEFDARVIKINGNRAVLDQTCFYPRGGGQAGDTGEVNGIRVIDTQENESGDIVHILEREVEFGVDVVSHGKIDWTRRYKIMKLHSASHIVYYLMQEIFGGECKPASSGLLDERKDRSDYLFTEKLDKQKLKVVEEKVNEIIKKGYDIKTWTDEKGQRYWKIEPFLIMKCGGTHVKNTREIGRITVKRGKKPGSGRERIEISLLQNA